MHRSSSSVIPSSPDSGTTPRPSACTPWRESKREQGWRAPYPRRRPSMAVQTVTITYKNKGELKITPQRVVIYYSKTDGTPDDKVKWVSKHCDATVRFNKNGTPFVGL